jgi:hypothetical protein
MDLDSPVNVVTGQQGQGSLSLVAGLGGGFLRIRNAENQQVVFLGAALTAAVLEVGGSGFNGNLVVKNLTGKTVLKVDAAGPQIQLRNDDGETTVVLDGETGDIRLVGADAAEDFEIADGHTNVAPGTVMVIERTGRLRESTDPYDRRVAGVICGAGGTRPGIVLGHASDGRQRRSLALAGTVYCKADAGAAPIEVGDLLTSSSTPGHAMKAVDRRRAFGAVMGKALQPLPQGRGLIPVLVALQ